MDEPLPKRHCPRWSELPELALYMDQVRIVLDDALTASSAPAPAPAVTATMINNYVKQKLVAPADRKKYSREHVSRLILICTLKQVLSLSEITAVLDELSAAHGPADGYDLFCGSLEAQLAGEPLPESCPELLAAALCALEGKLRVVRLVSARAAARTDAERTAEKPKPRSRERAKPAASAAEK